MEKSIKSKSRVKNFGEVFTAEREVKAMCDLIPSEIWENIESTFLEPACGNGNFLVKIFERKLAACHKKNDAIKALNSIFAVDILQDNVAEAKNRLYQMFVAKYGESKDALNILENNVICGNTLTGLRSDGEVIDFLIEKETI